MKKFLVLLLSLTLVLGLAACRRDDDPDPDPDPDPDNGDPDPDPDPVSQKGPLYIGTPEFSGEFINWGTSSSYDIAIRDLVQGQGVVAVTDEGEFVINENVVVNVSEVEAKMAEEVDEGVDKTYRWEIRDDMKWSDGESITAEDYIFAIKMQSAYSVSQAGHANPNAGIDLVGHDAWRQGCYGEWDEGAWVCDDDHDYTADPLDFKGLELVDDFTFELTIDGSALPYFYELAMVGAGPQPKHIYTNDGEFDFLTRDEHDALGDDDMHIGEWISQYISKPPVSSGPYVFDHYERDQFVRLKLNPHFNGDYRGHKAAIETVVIRVVPSATDIEHLLNGEIHILTGVVEGDKINRALEADHIQGIYFDRIGFGGLFFHTDFGPMLDYRVRQAIAYMVNREEFVSVFLEGYGTLINAPLGIGQWMYQESTRVPDELISYYPDMDKVHQLLDEAGWDKDEDGNDWVDKATSGYRYNADGEVLYLGWLGTETDYSDILSVYLTGTMEEAGIDFFARQAGFDVLLDNYYFAYEMDEEDRDYHMFNLATGYTALYDPYYFYHSDWLGTTGNSSQFEDSPDAPMADFSEQVGQGFSWDPTVDDGMTVDELTETMRLLPASESDQFLEYWDALMLRMNRLLPVLPLYSNQYYQFCNTQLEGFHMTGFWDWQDTIVDLRFVE